jgi:G:T-mismatch repair DNA endonuclease (very short patch repair protein)
MSNGGFWGPKLCLLVKMPFAGKSLWLEDILYEVLRCNLVHRAMLPATAKQEEGTRNKVVLEIDNNGVFVFHDALLDCLFRVVHNASENISEFGGVYLPPRGHPGVSIGSRGNPLVISTLRLEVPIP